MIDFDHLRIYDAIVFSEIIIKINNSYYYHDFLNVVPTFKQYPERNKIATKYMDGTLMTAPIRCFGEKTLLQLREKDH